MCESINICLNICLNCTFNRQNWNINLAMSCYNVMEDFGTPLAYGIRRIIRKYFIIQFGQNPSQHSQIFCHVTSLSTHCNYISVIRCFGILLTYEEALSQVEVCWVFIKYLSFIYVHRMVHILVILPAALFFH
jgi:hypothetical protein